MRVTRQCHSNAVFSFDSNAVFPLEVLKSETSAANLLEQVR
jgi:hypothetical protein